MTPEPHASVEMKNGWAWLEQARQDLGFALRQMLKAPGFSATVIGTMALAIGACTVVFTAVNSTLLHPLAGQKTDGEVIIHETLLPQYPQLQLSPAMFGDLMRETHSFEYLTAWTGYSLTLQADAEPVQVKGAAVSEGLMKMWSAKPALGRNIRTEEFAKGERVIMLSHALWQRAFGGSPNVINRVINADGIPCTVIGVISPEFARYGSDIEFWVPLLLTNDNLKERRSGRNLQVNAKLKPGVTVVMAQAELDVIAANLAREYPGTNKGVGLLVRDLGAYINRSLAPMLYILLGAVGCVLLIACANVANLLLARATARRREISIRTALGAGRGRLIRQLLAESLLLAAFGGGLGILLAQWGLRFIRIYGPTAGTDMARMAFIELDGTVLAFTAGFSLLTGVVFGLAPAWLASRADLSEALKQGSRGSAEGGVRGGLRNALVMLEVALALVLLAGAGLLVRSFARLADVDPGFAPDQVANMQLILNSRKYDSKEKRMQFTDLLLDHLHATPGVEAAVISNLTPFNTTGAGFNFRIVGRPQERPQPAAVPYLVTANYFKTMGIRLVRGRFLNVQDGVSGPLAFVINEKFARQYFPDEEALGKSLLIAAGRGPGMTGEIVGVIADVMQGMPGEPPLPQLYLPWAISPGTGFYLSVRTAGDPAALLPRVKEQVFALDRDQAVSGARTMSSLMDDKLARTHVMLGLLGIYSLIALVIAAVGIYGVMAYSVSQRTVEFGIRMALGASPVDVLRQVVRQGMVVVAAGLLGGIAAALALGRVVQSLLFNTSPRDPLTLAAIVGLLLLVSFVACLLPARRATKVDPVIALRAE